jgi:hypothetical protein
MHGVNKNYNVFFAAVYTDWMKIQPLIFLAAFSLTSSAHTFAADPAKPAKPPKPAQQQAKSATQQAPQAEPKAEAPTQPQAEPKSEPKIEPKSEPKHHRAEEESDMKTEGLLGPVLLGPTVGLIALPRPISLGLEGKIKDLFGFGAYYGFLPTLTISGVKAGLSGYDARFRYFPFHGSFFLGVGYGVQTIKASKTDSILGQTVTADAKVKTQFVTPHIGWRWLWKSGFFMGMDLGWQIGLSAKTTLSTNISEPLVLASSQYLDLQSKAEEQGNKLGKTGVPFITLLQFGWLF